MKLKHLNCDRDESGYVTLRAKKMNDKFIAENKAKKSQAGKSNDLNNLKLHHLKGTKDESHRLGLEAQKLIEEYTSQHKKKKDLNALILPKNTNHVRKEDKQLSSEAQQLMNKMIEKNKKKSQPKKKSK